MRIKFPWLLLNGDCGFMCKSLLFVILNALFGNLKLREISLNRRKKRKVTSALEQTIVLK